MSISGFLSSFSLHFLDLIWPSTLLFYVILYYLFIFLHQFSLVTQILYSHKTTVMFWLSVSGCYCNVLGKDNNEPRTLTHFITDKHLGSVSLFRQTSLRLGRIRLSRLVDVIRRIFIAIKKSSKSREIRSSHLPFWLRSVGTDEFQVKDDTTGGFFWAEHRNAAGPSAQRKALWADDSGRNVWNGAVVLQREGFSTSKQIDPRQNRLQPGTWSGIIRLIWPHPGKV